MCVSCVLYIACTHIQYKINCSCRGHQDREEREDFRDLLVMMVVTEQMVQGEQPVSINNLKPPIYSS